MFDSVNRGGISRAKHNDQYLHVQCVTLGCRCWTYCLLESRRVSRNYSEFGDCVGQVICLYVQQVHEVSIHSQTMGDALDYAFFVTRNSFTKINRLLF